MATSNSTVNSDLSRYPRSVRKVMCFGTFDNLHPGHLSFLKQAKKYGDYLIAVIARDRNVKKIKGKRPRQEEKLRLRNIKNISFVNKAVLGQLRDKFRVIKRYKPAVICLGYDQEVDGRELKKAFSGKIIRLKPYKEHIYKSSKLTTKAIPLSGTGELGIRIKSTRYGDGIK